MRWPEKHYLGSERHGFLYVPIPKVACSSLKAWVIAVEAGQDVSRRADPHLYVREHLELGVLPRGVAHYLLHDPRVFRFAFVRNPWDRLVSAFLNKFVPLPLKQPAVAFFQNVERRSTWLGRTLPGRWWPRVLRRPGTKGNDCDVACEELDQFTFRQFVAALYEMPASEYDVHWRPQIDFLAGRTLDLVGRFERLADDFRVVSEQLELDIPLPQRNRTPRQPIFGGCLADTPLAELRDMTQLPEASCFYPPELVEQVGEIYHEDIEAFGYEFRTATRRSA